MKKYLRTGITAAGMMASALCYPAEMVSGESANALTDSTVTSKVESIADKNLRIGQLFLKKNAKVKGVVTLSSGLQYRIIDPGTGGKPGPSDSVKVNYEGMHLNNQIFDSSYQRNQPITFQLNQVIQGWQQALPLMKKGSTWVLYIPADLAYGEHGAPPAIGPNETLIFKVQLLDVM